jgi:hypothetical protein
VGRSSKRCIFTAKLLSQSGATKSRRPTIRFVPPTAYCVLPTAYCQLRTAYCQLRYCLLLTCSRLLFRGIEVDYFSDAGKSYLNYFAIGRLDFHARCGQCLRSLHAANNAPDTLTVGGDYLDIIFAVKRLKGRKGLGNFHDYQYSFQRFFKLPPCL